MSHCRTTALALLSCLLLGTVANADQDLIDLSEPKPADVSIWAGPEGPIYTTAKGMTLYTRRRDQPNRSLCLDKKVEQTECCGGIVAPYPMIEYQKTCTEKSPPFVAPPGAKSIGKWSIIQRPDGISQWAYGSSPVYTSVRDKAPTQINGYTYGFLGSRGGESVIRVNYRSPPGVGTVETKKGISLAANGQVLYLLERDRGEKDQLCTGDCTKKWKPVVAPMMSGIKKNWSVITRAGVNQWAYRGQPVYTSSLDRVSGETNGLGVDGAKTIDIYTFPPLPPDITVQTLPFGDVFATRKGMTLYFIRCLEATSGTSCDEPGDTPAFVMSLCGGLNGDCSKIFKPYEAPANARPVPPYWSVVTVDPRNPVDKVKDPSQGVRAWAYQGRALYTYVHDEQPGDFEGAGVGEVRAGLRVANAYGPQLMGR
jgi:predicted lipoprotein with Yx(FWY)xxD motif